MKHYIVSGLVAAMIALAGCGSKEDALPKPVVEVEVAKADVVNVQLSVSAPATVFPVEQANIASRITAPIEKLHVRKGDSVKAGQLLAELRKSDLEAQRAELAAAVTDAEATMQKVVDGTAPTDLERARGQAATAKAALDQAQKFYDRRRELFRQGAIPNRDLVTAETDLAQAKTADEVARNSLDLLQKHSAAQDVQIARSRLEQARARLAQIEAQLTFADIRSPFSGTVSEQFMWPGDMANPNAPMFTVMNLSTAVARGQVAESEAAHVSAGQRCAFAASDQASARFEGHVSVVNKAVDPARRTVETWCEIPSPGATLRAGTFGSVTILTANEAGSIVVPLAAVQFGTGGSRGAVIVITDKSAAQRKDVEVGAITGGKVQIKKGLAAGDTVILSGGYGLEDGTAVKIADKKAEK
jgi:HlyD family secretion protein